MILKSDGGPGSRRNRDESYSEEEEEEDTSSTSVNDEDEEEEEEDEEEESESDSDEEEEEEERVAQKRPTRNSGPGSSNSSSSSKKENPPRGRMTRQKTRQDMPPKRLLRSRKKSPVAGAGSKVPQVFKCQNCRKEFPSKGSLGRHLGWCKPKKVNSPRKRKSEDATATTDTSKSEGKSPKPLINSVVASAATPSTLLLPQIPRGRGRPRKNPLSLAIQRKKQHRHEIMHHHYQEEVISGVAGTLAMLEEEFTQQQKSPGSSPGLAESSSEEDYEQKEFAANAHQLISHRNSSASIDVVNPDPPEVTEGPVTCPQCKMTYRTALGFQNHLPTCVPLSSDEDDEENEEEHLDTPPPQHHHNWAGHQTMHETLIAPPVQPVENLDEDSSSSEDVRVISHSKTNGTHFHPPPRVLQSTPAATYQEISIAPTGIGKSPVKIYLPPDNTPQVINSAGLTLERLPSAPKPHTSTFSPVRNPTVPSALLTAPVMVSQVAPPTTAIHSHSLNPSSLSQSQSVFQTATPPNLPIPPPATVSQTPLPVSLSSVSSAPVSRVASSSETSAALWQQLHAGGNPPTYTQAQLMPGTVLHNTIMQVPQQLSTTTGEAIHQHQPQQLPQQFPAAQYPSGFQNQTLQPGALVQPNFRAQNGMLTLGHPSVFPGGSNAQSQQHPQMSVGMTPQSVLRPSVPEQPRMITPQQLSNFMSQMSGLPGQPPTGPLHLSGGGIAVSAAHQGQPHPLLPNGNLAVPPFGMMQPPNQIPSQAFATAQNAQFSQSNTQVPNSSMTLPQLAQQPFPLQTNGLTPQQQLQVAQAQLPNGSLPNAVNGVHQLPGIGQQHQVGQYPGFLQNPPKLPEAQTQAPSSALPQQGVFANGTMHPFQIQPNSFSQAHHPTIQQPQPPQPIYQQPAQNLAPESASTSVMQPFPASSQQPEANHAGPANQQPHSISQPITNQSQTTNPPGVHQHGHVELNLQQQAQLQQQQQQFLALQQQQQQLQQNGGDAANANRVVAPATQTIPVMVNGTLQWIKVPVPQQQQQQQPQQSQESAVQPSVAAAPAQPPQISNQPPTATPQSGAVPAAPQPAPQVIQQLAQVTDSAGNTYLIMLPPSQPQQPASTTNGAQHILNLVPGLQGLACQQQRANPHCIANGGLHHSPGTSTSSGANYHAVGKSAPCPCVSCKEKQGTTGNLRKVLPHPSPNDSHVKAISPNIAPKPISIRPALLPKPPNATTTKVVRVQAAAAPGAPATRPTVQLTLANPQQPPPQQPAGSQVKIVPVQQHPAGLNGVQSVANTPISSSNIAVVRPMENPLQKLSDQISHLESTFLSQPAAAPTPPTSQTPPAVPSSTVVAPPAGSPPGPRLTLVSSSPPVSSSSPSQQITHVITLDPPPPGVVETTVEASIPPVNAETTSVLNIPMPRLGLVDHGLRPITVANLASSVVASPQMPSPSSSIQSISPPTTPLRTAKTNGTTPRGVKRKVLQVSPSGGGGAVGGSSAKSIKLSLHRKENADAYSIKNIEGDMQYPQEGQIFKSVRISGKITQGPQKDTATNILVVPSTRIVANPDPDQNETIAEDGLSPRSDSSLHCGGDTNNNGYSGRGNRVTHKVVVMYEVRKESTHELIFQSLNVYEVWDQVFQIVQGKGLNQSYQQVLYPSVGMARPQNDTEAQNVIKRLRIPHQALDFLLQSLRLLRKPSSDTSSSDSTKALANAVDSNRSVASGVVTSSGPCPLPSLPPSSSTQDLQRDPEHESEETDKPEVGSQSGCARLERFAGRKCFDMFGWLTSKHRNPPVDCDAPMESLKTLTAPIGMRYRKLNQKARAFLVIKKSDINGRGLFTKRDIRKGEMLIEYMGEVIRPHIADMREKYYESKGVGCYMFRVNDYQVIDATMKGNAARFINHSCEPNCEARTETIYGKDRIIIFAIRDISRGEELTYDYMFEKEKVKIICTCKSQTCRNYMN